MPALSPTFSSYSSPVNFSASNYLVIICSLNDSFHRLLTSSYLHRLEQRLLCVHPLRSISVSTILLLFTIHLLFSREKFLYKILSSGRSSLLAHLQFMLLTLQPTPNESRLPLGIWNKPTGSTPLTIWSWTGLARQNDLLKYLFNSLTMKIYH